MIIKKNKNIKEKKSDLLKKYHNALHKAEQLEKNSKKEMKASKDLLESET